MFGPNNTSLHEGTFLTMVLAIAGSALALWAVAPRVAYAVGGAQIAFSLVLFTLLTPPPQRFRSSS